MPPDFQAFHRSLAKELDSLKDRVRHLVPHWPTDGEHKEVVLRSILRQHVGESVHVGRGFIVSPGTEAQQIDVLVIDRDAPTLFRDGDLFIVTPDSVRAVLEVKTRCTGEAQITAAVSQLRARVSPWATATHRRIWSGLFVYEGNGGTTAQQNLLKSLAIAAGHAECPVDCVAIGGDLFVRWWPVEEGGAPQQAEPSDVWRAYGIDELAPSYFLGNLIAHLSHARVAENAPVWFPLPNPGKERFATLEIAPGDREPREAPR